MQIEVGFKRLSTEAAQELLERNIDDIIDGGWGDEEVVDMGMGYLFCLFDLGLINEFQLKYLDEMVLNEYRYR